MTVNASGGEADSASPPLVLGMFQLSFMLLRHIPCPAGYSFAPHLGHFSTFMPKRSGTLAPHSGHLSLVADTAKARSHKKYSQHQHSHVARL